MNTSRLSAGGEAWATGKVTMDNKEDIERGADMEGDIAHMEGREIYLFILPELYLTSGILPQQNVRTLNIKPSLTHGT